MLLEPGGSEGSDPFESMAVETVGALIHGATMVQRYKMEGKSLLLVMQ